MKKPSIPAGFWFWVCLLQITLPKANPTSRRGIVWENLLIVNAPNVQTAYRKAMKLGKEATSDFDCQGTLRLDGKPAKAKFLGISDMGLIHEELKDGAEICFHEWRSSLHKTQLCVDTKEKIIARLNKEIAPYQMNSANNSASSLF